MGIDISTRASEGADALAALEQERLPTVKCSSLSPGLRTVDPPQGHAAAVQDALALDAWQVSGGLVEATGCRERLSRPLLPVEPGAVVVERAP